MGDECSTLDVSCHIDSFWASIGNALGTMSWDMIAASFTGSAATVDSGEWSIAVNMTSMWAIVLLTVVVAVVVLELMMAAIRGDFQGAVSTVISGMLAWPLTLVAIWGAVQLTAASDRLSVAILNTGSDDGKSTMQRLFSFMEYTSVFGPVEGARQNMVGAVLILSVAFLAAFFLSFAMAFRNFALISLVGFAPLAFMAFPMRNMRSWVFRWIQAVVALILAKPIAAGILVFSAQLGASEEGGAWQWLVALVGMAMAAFAPMITMRMFSFIGAETAQAYGGQGQAVVTNTASGAGRAGSTAVGIAR